MLESGRLCEAAICYTGDLFDPRRATYSLDYYIAMGRRLKAAGTHILGIKDMAGLLKPAAARTLVQALKAETGLPIHLHTHDTSGISAATVLAAVEAGADIIDAAMDSLSGQTSQAPLGSIVAALQHTERDTRLDMAAIGRLRDYWEAVRMQYTAFESDLRGGTAEVYLHEMPGGQFTNLREQARSLGLADRWHEVAAMYAEVNAMVGDIVKVTPSSKVVGDMALAMVAGDLTRAEVEDPEREVAFPDSFRAMMRGDLGQPPSGWPAGLQAKVLKGETPMRDRPGAHLPPLDLEASRAEAQKAIGRAITDEELQSWLMYPQVFTAYAKRADQYGPVTVLPTRVFFYGMEPGDEITLDLEEGKSPIIRCQAVGEADSDGLVRVFFELNGQPRMVKVPDRALAPTAGRHPKADPQDPTHIAAPMPGTVVSVAVKEGQSVAVGDLLLVLEAMKMETALHAERAGTVARLPVFAGDSVEAKDLLLILAPEHQSLRV